MGSNTLLLNWNNHKTNVINEFQQLFSRSELTDVTLVCEGFSLRAHKAVLSASSSFFHSMFLYNPCKHAFVILADVNAEDLKAIVDFMYQGQVHVSQEKLSQFLTVARKLKIKGLSSATENETHESLEEMTNMESPTQISASSELEFPKESVSSALYFEKRSQTEVEFTSTVSQNCSLTHKTFCDNEQTVNSCDNSLAQRNTSEAYSNVSTQASGNPSLESAPAVEDVGSDSSSSCRITKYESYSSASVSYRDDIMVNVEGLSEKQADRLRSDALFQTNRAEQIKFRVNPSEVPFPSVKEEPANSTCSEHQDNSICELEPTLSLTSDINIPSNSGCLQNQPFPPAGTSVSKERLQHSHSTYPTDGIENCPESLREMEDPEVITASDTQDETCQVVVASSMPSFQTSELQEAENSTRKVDYLDIPNFKCYICKREFESSCALLTHQATHTVGPPFHCDICGKRIKTRQGMKFHIMRHTGDKPYSCNICGRKFLRQHVMETHRRIHTGERPFECNYCKKRFSDKSNLVVHTRVHTGEKPYSCHICKRDFPQKKNLLDHLHTHFRKHQLPLL